jgi:hypothetical protein
MLGYIVFHVVHEHLPQSSACECNSVTCADSPSVRNRRMLSCSRAVCHICGRTTTGTSHPAFLFTSLLLPFLGIPQPLHIPVKDTGRRAVLLIRDVSSTRVLEKFRRDLETAVRCDRPGLDSRTCGLAHGVGSVGGVLLVPTSSLVRMTLGFIAVSD